MKDSVYHVLMGVMSGETLRDPAQRFASVAASCVHGHTGFDAFMAACCSRYGRSHNPTSIEADMLELLHTDLNPTTQTVRHLLHAENVVFGYSIYRTLPHLHPGFSTEVHRWMRQHSPLPASSDTPASTTSETLRVTTPADVDQPAHARQAASELLTQIVVTRSTTVRPTTLTDVAQHLGVAHRAAAQVAAVLESGCAADLSATARLLGTSQRTLQRRLKAEHTSFETLRSAARLTSAMHALRSGQNLTAVAHEVGYTDSAHFSHSFKQACGMPPTVARLLLQGPVVPEVWPEPTCPVQVGASIQDKLPA